jgi:hypothetical protein
MIQVHHYTMKRISMTDEQIIEDLRNTFGKEFTAADVRGYCASKSISYPTVTKRLDDFKVGRGKWNLEVTRQAIQKLENTYHSPSASPIGVIESVNQNLVPQKDSTFVPFGNFRDIKKIIQSGIFYPTFITGLSGNGKTFEVEQSCAQLGFRLKANSEGATETAWHNGPVIEAMERGAVLLLDECLDENEEVLVGDLNNHHPVKLSELQFNIEYPIVSFNMKTGELENDTGSIISDKEDDIYEVELENGKVIRLNAKHPFITIDENGNYVEKTIEMGLSIGESVITFD